MAQSRTGLRQSLGALAYGDFRRLAAAQLFTSLGTQLLQTAIFWQVFALTESALLLGLTGLARAGPHIVLSMAGGVLAAQFYAQLVELSGLDSEPLPAQMDRSQWPAVKLRIMEIFKSKTRDEWCQIMEGTDVCFAPVLSMKEAPLHAHNKHRETFVENAGIVQPAPAPRFSRTSAKILRPPANPGEHTDEALAEWGFSAQDLAALREAKAIA